MPDSNSPCIFWTTVSFLTRVYIFSPFYLLSLVCFLEDNKCSMVVKRTKSEEKDAFQRNAFPFILHAMKWYLLMDFCLFCLLTLECIFHEESNLSDLFIHLASVSSITPGRQWVLTNTCSVNTQMNTRALHKVKNKQTKPSNNSKSVCEGKEAFEEAWEEQSERGRTEWHPLSRSYCVWLYVWVWVYTHTVMY